MRKKIFIIFIFLITVIVLLVWNKKVVPDKLVSSQLISTQEKPTPTVTLVPSPTPLAINEDTNLKEAVDKLSPVNFTEDFKKLQQEANNF